MADKHTPGPWAAVECPWDDNGYVTAVATGGRVPTYLADTHHNWHEADHGERRISWAEAQANARLIAEAPAMLDALRAMIEMATHHAMPPEERLSILRNARDVVARIDRGNGGA